MRISLIGFKDNSVNLFAELGKALSKKISGVELEERFAPFAEDIPVIALEASAESDFIFVFALVEEEEEAAFLRRKLIDVELLTKTRILKAVDADDFSGLDEDDFGQRKEEYVEKFTALILGILFNERSFAPKDKDFSL